MTLEAFNLRALCERTLTDAGQHLRLAHCVGVSHTAARLGHALDLPEGWPELLRTVGFVHDVGYGVSGGTGLHFIDGAEFLRENGAPDDVVWLVRWHSTALWEARAAGVPGTPESVEDIEGITPMRRKALEVLTLADFTTSPEGLPTTLQDRRAGICERYPDPAAPVRVALDEGWPWVMRAAHVNAKALNLYTGTVR